jgi:ribosome-associated protein
LLHGGGYDTPLGALTATPISTHVTQTQKRLLRARPVRCRRQRTGPRAQGRAQRHARCQPHRLKRESDALQDLGKELLTLRADLFDTLGLPDKLRDAMPKPRRITNFEGKRRQMQFVGKLMRKLDEARRWSRPRRAGRTAQRLGQEKLAPAPGRAVARPPDCRRRAPCRMDGPVPGTDIQQLRALIRQARKDAPAPTTQRPPSQGLAPRKGRAYRELFQLVREQMGGTGPCRATRSRRRRAMTDPPCSHEP